MSQETKPKVQRRKAGLYVVLGGIGTLCLGYVLLSQGSITAAPLLIVGSFGVMAAGILMGWD